MPYGDFSVLSASKILVVFKDEVKHYLSESSRCALAVTVSTCFEPVEVLTLTQSRPRRMGFKTQFFDVSLLKIPDL